MPPDIDTAASPPAAKGPVMLAKAAVNTRSSMERTRIRPRRWHMASNTRSSPTSEPVWACAACAVISLLPIFSTTMGLATASARSAAAAKRCGSRTVSANTAMERVCSSSTR
ncbi:hypothetical protein D9M68_642160 [compost metagenome]